MPEINLETIQDALFSNRKIRDRITRDYNLTQDLPTSRQFTEAVINQLGQAPAKSPLEQSLTDDQVFKAAVRAIGSNSRSWARYLRAEPELTRVLEKFSVARVRLSGRTETEIQERIRLLLGGITARSDANAIVRWSVQLAQYPRYCDRILQLANAIFIAFTRLTNEPIPSHEIMICAVSALAKPAAATNVEVKEALRSFGQAQKLSGMSYVLGSEFFRNMGWSGFKPDRHIKRLMGHWEITTTPEIERRVRLLARVLGTADPDFFDFASHSLRGVMLTPGSCSFSTADNHMWLLGAYVEKKGRESSCQYLQ